MFYNWSYTNRLAGRPTQRVSGIYARLLKQGCFYLFRNGWEVSSTNLLVLILSHSAFSKRAFSFVKDVQQVSAAFNLSLASSYKEVYLHITIFSSEFFVCKILKSVFS